MINFEFVVFANSFKNKFHCVAGKTTNNKKWIRPVSNKNGGELNHEQIKYKNQYGIFSVKTLQIINLYLDEHVPLPNQPENYLVSNKIWTQNYRIESNEIFNYLDSPANLWGDGDRVSYDKIIKNYVSINQSLYLVKVSNLVLYRSEDNKRRAIFTYNKVNYNLAVTDPNFDDILNKLNSIQSVLCISLGSNFQGNCFKLVAGIF